MVLLLIALASLIGMQSSNPHPTPLPLHVALDAGVLAASSKNTTQSINTNLDASYDFGRNTLKIFGGYLKTSTGSIDSALHWTAGARYEYEYMDRSRAYLDYYAEADPFIGYVQRDNQGIGYQYMLHKDQTLRWWGELGYLHSRTSVVTDGVLYESKLQLASHTDWRFAKYWTLQGWLLILPNLTNTDQDMISYEITLTSVVNSWLAIRAGYIFRYLETPYRGSRFQNIDSLNFVIEF